MGLGKRELKIGRVVTLNSEWLGNDNPRKMTIANVHYHAEYTGVDCEWLNDEGNPCREKYDARMLTSV